MPADVPAISIKIVAGHARYLTEPRQRGPEAGNIWYPPAWRQLRLSNPGARRVIPLAEDRAASIKHQAIAAALPVPAREYLAELAGAARGWRAQPSLGMQAQPGQRPLSQHRPGISGQLTQPEPQLERHIPAVPAGRPREETGTAARRHRASRKPEGPRHSCGTSRSSRRSPEAAGLPTRASRARP